VLAAYTYSSGLRAPALIAFVKDTLIYVVIIVAVIYIPTQLGGWGNIFDSAGKAFETFNADNADKIAAGEASGRSLVPSAGASQWAYASLSLGSALALFMYPHSVTAVLSTKNRNIIRRNAALLPAYSLLLGLLALLGIVAIAAGIQVKNPQLAIPQLFEQEFSPWFAGVAFAAIVIGDPGSHFGGSVGPLEIFGISISNNLIYFGITALVLNLVVAVIGTYVCRALDVDAGTDDTHPTDYLADAGDPDVTDRLDPMSTPPVD